MVHQNNRSQMKVRFPHQVLVASLQKDSKHFSKLPFAPVIFFSKFLIISIRPCSSQSNAEDKPQMRNHLMCSLCGQRIICAANKAPFCVLARFQIVLSLDYEHQLDEVAVAFVQLHYKLTHEWWGECQCPEVASQGLKYVVWRYSKLSLTGQEIHRLT